MKTQKTVIWILSGVIFLLTALYLFERHKYRSWIWDIGRENISLERYKYYRESRDLIYYGLSKDSVVKMLPEPEFDFVVKLDSSMKATYNHWYYKHFFETYLKSRYDTIEVKIVRWRIPYHEIPNLFLGFIKRDSVWVVDDGIQWDDNTYID